jgi:hypothetical protein
MAAKKNKTLSVVGIGAAIAAAWYFFFRTKAGASTLNTVQNTTGIKLFDLEPSYGTPERKMFDPQGGKIASIVEYTMIKDLGNKALDMPAQDRVEFGTIVSTRLMRNFKTLERANENTIAQLARQDPAYQKMLAQYAKTGKFWAGGSVDLG